MNKKRGILLLISLLFLNKVSFSSIQENSQEEKIICTKYGKTKIYKGPGQGFDISYSVNQRNYPFKVLREFSPWYLVKNYQEQVGWVWQSKIKHDCSNYKITKEESYLYRSPMIHKKKHPIAKIPLGVVVQVIRIEKDPYEVLRVRIRNISGWVKPEKFW